MTPQPNESVIHNDSRYCTVENNFYRRDDGQVLCFSCNHDRLGCFCKQKRVKEAQERKSTMTNESVKDGK